MPHDLFDLSGCVAVVLGATSGIGRALAVGLAGAGADVVPAGRRSALVDEAAREIEQLGRRMLAQACDVRSRESIDRLCDAVLEKFGRVDILLNAAGQIFRKPTQRIGEAEWDALMDVNVTVCALPELLWASGGERPRPRHQHRVAQFVRGAGGGRRLRGVEGSGALAHPQPRGGMGSARDLGQRHRAGRHQPANDGNARQPQPRSLVAGKLELIRLRSLSKRLISQIRGTGIPSGRRITQDLCRTANAQNIDLSRGSGTRREDGDHDTG